MTGHKLSTFFCITSGTLDMRARQFVGARLRGRTFHMFFGLRNGEAISLDFLGGDSLGVL